MLKECVPNWDGLFWMDRLGGNVMLKANKSSRLKADMAAKRHKNHKNKTSGLVISMGYETEIREI